MSGNDMTSKVHQIRELKRMAEELQAEIDAIQDEIKAEMKARDSFELSGPDWKVTWNEVTSSRFNTAAFKKEWPKLYEAFTKPTTSRRFTLA